MSTPRTMDGNRQHHVFSDEQMADYLDVRLHLTGCNADSVGQALLLVSELYGMGFVAAPSGLTAEANAQIAGRLPAAGYGDSAGGPARAWAEATRGGRRMSGGAAHDPAWRAAFDATLVKHFGLSLEEAGAEGVVLQRYADLEGSEAAMAFADDYELARLDWWSWER